MLKTETLERSDMQWGRYGKEDQPPVRFRSALCRDARHKEALFFPKYLPKATIWPRAEREFKCESYKRKPRLHLRGARATATPKCAPGSTFRGSASTMTRIGGYR